MKEEIKIQSPIVGMNSDNHESGLQQGEYFIARNSNIQTKDGGKHYITSDPSNLLTSTIKEGYKVVGRESNYREDRTYLMLLNPQTNHSEIGYIDHITEEETMKQESEYIGELSEQDVTLEELYNSGAVVGFKEYTTLIEDCEEDPCLNFDLDKPIHTIAIRNEASGTKISWTFGEMPMTLDLGKIDSEYIVGVDKCIDCKKLKVFRDFKRIFIEEDSITEGELDKAQYQFYAAYCTEDGIVETEYHAQTPVIKISDVQDTVIDMTDLESTSGNGIKLKVTSIDEDREYFKVAVSVTKTGGTVYYEMGVYSTDSTTIILNTNPSTNPSNRTMSGIEELKVKTPHYISSERLEAMDGYLTHMNVKQHREINLQPVVNLMGVHAKWATVEVSEEFYQNMIPSSQMTSAMRDEVYPHAISFETDTGYETAKFPLISRPADSWEVSEVINSEGEIEEGFENIVNSILDGKNDCATTDRTQVWQYLNTAEEQGTFPNYEFSKERASGEVYKYVFTDGAGVLKDGAGVLKDPITMSGSFENKCTEEDQRIDFPFDFVLDSDVFGEGVDLKTAIDDNYNYISNYCIYKRNGAYTDSEKTLLYLKDRLTDTDSFSSQAIVPTLTEMGGECEDEPEQGEVCCSDLEEIEESRETSLQEVGEVEIETTYRTIDRYPSMDPPDQCYMIRTDSDGDKEILNELDVQSRQGREKYRVYLRESSQLITDRDGAREATDSTGDAEIVFPSYHFGIVHDAPLCLESSIIQEIEDCDQTTSSRDNLKQQNGPVMIPSVHGSLTTRASGTYEIEFPDRLTKGAAWFKITPGGRKGAVFKISKFDLDTNHSWWSIMRDAHLYRVSFFKGKSNEPFKQEVRTGKRDFKIGMAFSEDLLGYEGFEDLTDISSNEEVYISIDLPITGTRGREVRNSSDDVFFVYTPEGCFSTSFEDIREEHTTFKFDKVGLDLKQVYKATCSYSVPQPDDCRPQAYKYGRFSYVESSELYPNNKELYDSSNLIVKRSHFSRTRGKPVLSTQTDAALQPHKTMTEFEQAYTEGVNEKGEFKLKGVDFTKKKIRHFKYPDNSLTPLLPNYRTADFSDTTVQPIGIHLDEKIVEAYLDIAEYNGLLSKEERNSIISYTLHIGDRTGEKTVISKGIAFDMYKYEEDRDILFSNFPFNTLGSNNFILDKTGRDLKHPYSSSRNDKFTVMTPETYLSNKLSPTEIKVEGYMYGSSENKVSEIKEHAKQVILGNNSRGLATTLATAEVLTGILMETLSGLETARIGAGLYFSANIPGVIINAYNVAKALKESVAEVGKLRYQWLETFEALGKPVNFTYRTTGVGKYNYLMPDNSNKFTYKGREFNDNVRGLLSNRRLDQTNEIVTDRKGHRDYINNQHREESMFIKTGKPIEYPSEYIAYDNSETSPAQSSRIAGTGVERGKEVYRNIASPYIALKNYRPGQYGKVGSIKWLNTGYRKEFGKNYRDGMPPIAFGGGVYIARVSDIRKASIFRENFMDIGDRVPFEYSLYPMYGYKSKYYLDYKVTSQRSLKQFIMPSLVDKHNFDMPDSSSDFYVKEPSRFYLQSYGVVDYITETELNPFFRISDKSDHKTLYYGQTKDYERLTEEVVRPIQTKNTFIYNPVYLRKGEYSLQTTIPSTYNKVESDYRTKGENTVVISQPNYSDFNTYDPWKVYMARDQQQFNNYGGKLKDVMALTSQQVMLRFENGLSILNPQTSSKKDTIKSAIEIIRSQKIEFTKSETGYAGTENTAYLNTEAGTVILETKRGAVFLVNSSGVSAPELQEISKVYGDQPTNMGRWFQENLPFHIKTNKIKNYQDINVNNNFNGVGISLGYDNIHKQILISKKDFVPLKNNIEYRDGEFYHEDYDLDYIVNGMQIGDWEIDFIDYEKKEVHLKKEKDFNPQEVLDKLSIFVETRKDPRAVEWEYMEQGYETSNYIKSHRMICTSDLARVSGGYYDLKVNGKGRGKLNLTNTRQGLSAAIVDTGNHPKEAWGESPYDDANLDRYDEKILKGSALMTAGEEPLLSSGELNIELVPSSTPVRNTKSTEGIWLRVFFEGEVIYSDCLRDGKTKTIKLTEIEKVKLYERNIVKIPGLLEVPEVFEDAGWTIAFNMERGKWTSFFDFVPDYYINTPRYFQTGINKGRESSIWAHGMTNRSFNTYYGEPKSWGIEMPISFDLTDNRLDVVKYMMESKRHQGYGYHNFVMNERIGMDRATVTGLKSSTGHLNLKPIETPWQRTLYPITRPEQAEQDIAQTYSRGTWSFNMVADRLKEGNQIWRHNLDGNTKDLIIPSHDYSRVQLKRLEDTSNKIYLTSKDTKHSKQLLIGLFNESTKTDR